MAHRPSMIRRALRGSSASLVRRSGLASHLALARVGMLGVVILFTAAFVMTAVIKALGIPVSKDAERDLVGIFFFAGTSAWGLLFIARSLIQNRVIDWAAYVSRFRPAARIWFAIAFTIMTGLSLDLVIGAPSRNGFIPGWVLGLSWIGLYYFVPLWLARRSTPPKPSEE